MKAISNWLDRFCYKHPNFGIPELMKYVALGNVLIFVGDLMTEGGLSWFTKFYPELIFQGQIWRLITFIFVPLNTQDSSMFITTLLFALVTFFYYQIGTALERQWGTTRFTLFYLMGVVFNLIVGFIIYAVYPVTHDLLGGYYYETAQMYYVNLSMFFSFATLYPNMQVLLYGIIPIKVKWLAYFDVALFAFDIFASLASANILGALLPIVAVLNYLIFFWQDLAGIFTRKRQRVTHQVNPQTINFKKAQREVQERKGYLHKCTVCGVTDADNPDMEFRYCSKCNGYYCYCMNHINDHVHVK